MLPFADLQREIAEQTQAALANVQVVRAAGKPPFNARLSIADRDAFQVAIVATHTLRYLDQAPPLRKDEVLDIGGINFKVIDPPRRLNAHEMTAELVQI